MFCRRLFEKDGRHSRDSYLLSDSFDSPSRVRDNPTFIDNALRGLIQTPAQAVDNCFADDITSQLFKYVYNSLLTGLFQIARSKFNTTMNHNQCLNCIFFNRPKTRNLGLDLISLNIQRGRDHALTPYILYWLYTTSNHIYSSMPQNFDQLVPRIPQEVF